jgi:hypothetical protein
METEEGATEVESGPEKFEFSDPEGFGENAGSSLIPPELDLEE